MELDKLVDDSYCSSMEMVALIFEDVSLEKDWILYVLASGFAD